MKKLLLLLIGIIFFVANTNATNTNFLGAREVVAAKGGTSIWSSTSKLSSVKNAFGHWKKHAAEFPEFVNAKQYVEGAKNFLNNSPGVAAEVYATYGALATAEAAVTAGTAGKGILDKAKEIASNGGTKLLQQFANSTIDKAVSLTVKQKELHIFVNKLHPKPWLNQLSVQLGGNQNVIKAALENANGRILPNASGIFNTPVSVGGVNFIIRGYINQGTPIINSIFKP